MCCSGGYEAETEPRSFVVASLRSAENAHRVVGTGSYESKQPLTPPQPGGLLRGQAAQDAQEGQPRRPGQPEPSPGLCTLSEAASAVAEAESLERQEAHKVETSQS